MASVQPPILVLMVNTFSAKLNSNFWLTKCGGDRRGGGGVSELLTSRTVYSALLVPAHFRRGPASVCFSNCAWVSHLPALPLLPPHIDMLPLLLPYSHPLSSLTKMVRNGELSAFTISDHFSLPIIANNKSISLLERGMFMYRCHRSHKHAF